MRYYLIAFVVLLLDQVTKWLVVRNMEVGESIPLLEGVFHITSHRNRGAAFGILQDQRWFFIAVTIIVVVGIVVYLRKIHREKPRLAVALSLILGGAVGNFIDRAATGEVVDFLDFTLIDYPIFNVADSAIVIGVALFLWDSVREMRAEKGS
ncbi:signal peptidase II [Bacillaceae bacterium]